MRENDYNRPTDFSQIKAQVSGMEAVKIKAVLNQNVFGNLLLGILTESFEIEKYFIDLDFTLGSHMEFKFSCNGTEYIFSQTVSQKQLHCLLGP